MNKTLFIAATLLCFALSGCASKTAKKTDTLVGAETSTTSANRATSQSKDSPSAAQGSDSSDRQLKTVSAANIAIEPVYFNYDSYLLSDVARTSLGNTAQVFLQDRKLKAIVAGHCDERGSEMYNIALGEKRALSVKNYLTNLGVEADRLEVVSFGEEKPAVEGSDEAAWSLNRRVEFN